MRKKLIYLVLLFSAAVFAAGFFCPSRVKGNVSVEGISLRGLNERQAQNALAPLFHAWQNRRILLTLPTGTEISLSAPDIGVTTDFSAIWQKAIRVKRGKGANFPLTPTFSLKDFPAISQTIAKQLYLAPQNAVLSFFPNSTNMFTITPEKQGRQVDEYLLLKNILSLLPALKTHEQISVAVPVKTLAPTITEKDLQQRHATLATFSTSYGSSLKERKHNVFLAASKLHGKTLYPGETLSFNACVGERTEQAGFLKAKVIEKGAFTEGVGGGVCQVSGTLYNAAVLSGLTITEYHQHSLAVSYLPPGRDAMVNYGTADLKIRNDFPHPVFLTAKADGNILSFTFYGAPTGKTYALESTVTGTVPAPEPLIEQDDGSLFPELKVGEQKIIQREKAGILSECYLLVTEKGKTTKILLRKNKYLPVRGHVVFGGAQPKTEQPPTPSPAFCA